MGATYDQGSTPIGHSQQASSLGAACSMHIVCVRLHSSADLLELEVWIKVDVTVIVSEGQHAKHTAAVA